MYIHVCINYFIHIYCTDAAIVKMNEMKNIEIGRLKAEKTQSIKSVMEATGEQFSQSLCFKSIQHIE